MPKFTMKYTLTEVTERQVEVEADNEEDAIEAMQNYEVDTSDSYQVNSIRWEIEDIEVVSADAEPTIG